jgi:hypothetical protein
VQVADIFEGQQPAALLPALNALHADLGVALEVSFMQQHDEVLDVVLGHEASLLAVEHSKQHCMCMVYKIKDTCSGEIIIITQFSSVQFSSAATIISSYIH